MLMVMSVSMSVKEEDDEMKEAGSKKRRGSLLFTVRLRGRRGGFWASS